jgi:hypothetical protein
MIIAHVEERRSCKSVALLFASARLGLGLEEAGIGGFQGDLA